MNWGDKVFNGISHQNISNCSLNINSLILIALMGGNYVFTNTSSFELYSWSVVKLLYYILK